MIFFTALSDVLLYLAFSYMIGSIVLGFVPADRKPRIQDSRKLQLISVAGIALFSLAPVIELVVFLNNGQGVFSTFFRVLMDFRIGNGWVLTLLFCILLGLTVFYSGSAHMRAYYTASLVLIVGFFSHVSTLNLWAGFFSHSIHFLSMSLWIGVLLHIAWLAHDGSNWKPFTAWFTPFAIACLAALFISGIVIMLFFVNPTDYAKSWVLPYGQMLLLKHLAIVPVLAAALINGFLNKKGLYERTWLQVEFLLILLVFASTAFMSKQAPPHDINDTFRSEGMAPFVELLKGPQYVPIDGALAFSLNGALLIAIGLMCLGLMVLGYKKQLPPWLSLLFGLVFVGTVYGGLMLNTAF
ncbi:putative copper resistance protein D [Planococcus glaciei]|uniref:copper resistance D family protein n=1 Tax=Planococcus glaciei TaxID=459472 RepID=UPI0008810ABC|nr:CopD family protein [Planococcus glaciei]SDG62823.1 putative copper resistance protein D [Planococcus glaciei]